MALDAQPLLPEPRPAARPSTATAERRGQRARVRQPVRAAVRRRFEEAALAAAVRELRTYRHSRIPG